jgi:hypothetical protein
MTPTDWLAAWVASLASFQTVAVVLLALVLGVSCVRVLVSILKGATR